MRRNRIVQTRAFCISYEKVITNVIIIMIEQFTVKRYKKAIKRFIFIVN